MMNAVDIRDYHTTTQGIDFGDTITHECVCGGNLFRLVVSFEDYEIAGYLTEMECIECNSRYTAPTPLDDPEYQE